MNAGSWWVIVYFPPLAAPRMGHPSLGRSRYGDSDALRQNDDRLGQIERLAGREPAEVHIAVIRRFAEELRDDGIREAAVVGLGPADGFGGWRVGPLLRDAAGFLKQRGVDETMG